MRAVVQRVTSVRLTVDAETVSNIGPGLLVLLGVARDDSRDDAAVLATKTASLRIFPDAGGKLNLSAIEAGREIMAVSQFTLLGDARRGRRPGFSEAARPETAEPLYQHFIGRLREAGLPVAEGVFGADMQIDLRLDGPVTILLDSQRLF